MKDTIAIIGSHPATRDQFDFDRTDSDVWVFNEALSNEWCQWATGVFQLHKPTIFRASTNRNDPKHYEWLKTQTDVTVYMQDKYEDVPMSERYPLEDALALTPGFSYFTSSVAYALALAILNGYKRIELYGVEMETGTEYAHQRPGVAFLAGVAIGRGIEFIHYSSGFWQVPLYGYEGNEKIPLDKYQMRLGQLEQPVKDAKQGYEDIRSTLDDMLVAFIQTYKTNLTQLDNVITACGQAAVNFGSLDGAKQVNEKYLAQCEKMLEDTGDYLIVRQEYESNMHGGGKLKMEQTTKMHMAAKLLQDSRKKLNTNASRDRREYLVSEFKRYFEKYIEAATKIGMGNGITLENRNMLVYYDNLLASEGAPIEIEQEVEAVPA